jgi:hypothetical protein
VGSVAPNPDGRSDRAIRDRAVRTSRVDLSLGGAIGVNLKVEAEQAEAEQEICARFLFAAFTRPTTLCPLGQG